MHIKYLAISGFIALCTLTAGVALGCDGDGKGRRRGPPPVALDACDGAAEDEACEFEGRRGIVSGTCREVRDGFACVPEHHRKRAPEGAPNNLPPDDLEEESA